MHEYICVAYVWWPQDKRLCLPSGPVHPVHLFFLRKAGAAHWPDLGNSRAFPASASPVLGLQEPATTSNSFKTLNLRTKLIW